jgi:hypothetical protein
VQDRHLLSGEPPVQLLKEADLPLVVWCNRKVKEHGLTVSSHIVADLTADLAVGKSQPISFAFHVHEHGLPVADYITQLATGTWFET